MRDNKRFSAGCILAAAAHVQEDLLPEGNCTAKRKQKV